MQRAHIKIYTSIGMIRGRHNNHRAKPIFRRNLEEHTFLYNSDVKYLAIIVQQCVYCMSKCTQAYVYCKTLVPPPCTEPNGQ